MKKFLFLEGIILSHILYLYCVYSLVIYLPIYYNTRLTNNAYSLITERKQTRKIKIKHYLHFRNCGNKLCYCCYINKCKV